MSAEVLSVQVQVGFQGFELDVAEDIALTGVTAIFGPSGCGKSTLLRTIAGFETPRAGRIYCGTDAWFDATKGIDVAPYRRAVGFMFQDTRLFAHLDVAGNLAFAEKRRRPTHRHIERSDVIAALDIEPLLSRRVDALSGGERQRVALARTLLTGPRVLLLDEPLTALDRERKAEILPYLENLPHRFGIPTLYVSHDVDEIARLADRALVLAGGRTQLHDSIAAAVERLDLQTYAGRFDAGVLVEGYIASHDTRLRATIVDLNGDTLMIPLVGHLPPGDPIRLRIRARDVAIAIRRPEGLSIRNVFAGQLSSLSADPETGFVEAVVDARGGRIRARLTRAAVEDLALVRGMPVFALVKSVTFERGA
jgi:molybdate transport system ATP-binding protein